MIDVLRREFVYLWYYFILQLRQIFPYWVWGMMLGSVVSVFAKNKMHAAFRALQGKEIGILGILLASILGIASPLCMYGTIPVAASFSKSGIKDDWLAAFMMSSILLNPQLIVYSAALGAVVLTIRIIFCFMCGVLAGFFVRWFYREKNFFDFSGFTEPQNRDTDPKLFIRFLKNIGRNVKATGFYFFLGVALSALFQRYVPAELVSSLFGKDKGFGILIAATIGVPLYACGGGTIPLLIQWLSDGMSIGSATAFMVTGPATKITNLGAVKIVLGIKRFLLYIAFTIVFAVAIGIVINHFLSV